MNRPVLRYYGLFEDVTKGRTPKYCLTANVGKIAPVEALRGRDGSTVVYYVPSRYNSGKPDAPCMRLQAARNLNLTGLRWLRGYAGYAYGWPEAGAAYGRHVKRANPFNSPRYAFVFIMHGAVRDGREEYDRRPRSFEWLVFECDNPKTDAARLCRSIAAPAGTTLDLLEQIRGMRVNVGPQPFL